MGVPTCFISYSWENETHRNWVRQLASELQNNGVKVLLDQWDLKPGSDLPHYMETAVRESDYVILVCTPYFAVKANAGVGGVGYEKNIVTGEIFLGIATPNKFVPILRHGDPVVALPSYLTSRLYVDMSNDATFKEQVEELLRHFHGRPRYTRPQLGPPPSYDEVPAPKSILTPVVTTEPESEMINTSLKKPQDSNPTFASPDKLINKRFSDQIPSNQPAPLPTLTEEVFQGPSWDSGELVRAREAIEREACLSIDELESMPLEVLRYIAREGVVTCDYDYHGYHLDPNILPEAPFGLSEWQFAGIIDDLHYDGLIEQEDLPGERWEWKVTQAGLDRLAGSDSDEDEED